MRRILLVIDLEGVGGVDEIAALLAGTSAYRRAQRLLTEEVNLVARVLLQSGFDRVRISDSHISGSGETNLLVPQLEAGIELCVAEDPYEDAMFADVHAVAALGMHAAAGQSGFAAHTMNLHTRWSLDGRLQSETDLVMALAAERGLSFCFATGDEVLGAHLPEGLAYLVTKTRADRGFVSKPREEIFAGLRALAEAPVPPVRSSPSNSPIRLRMKSAWQAEAVDVGVARRVGPLDFEVGGETFGARYRDAWAQSERAGEGLDEAIRGSPGSSVFLSDVTLLLGRGFDREVVEVAREEVELGLEAFYAATSGASSEARALRALIVHMFEHHAPRVFAELQMGPRLEAALLDLAQVPAELDPAAESDELQARVDARYVEHMRGRSGPSIERRALLETLEALSVRGDEIYAFILASMSHAMGIEVPSVWLQAPPLAERVLELYVQTHELLFASDYLARPLAPASNGPASERLLLSASWIIEREHVDLAAEVAVLLQALDEVSAPEHAALLALVRRNTDRTGQVRDASLGSPPEALADHATGVALLMLAGARERFRVNT